MVFGAGFLVILNSGIAKSVVQISLSSQTVLYDRKLILLSNRYLRLKGKRVLAVLIIFATRSLDSQIKLTQRTLQFQNLKFSVYRVVRKREKG